MVQSTYDPCLLFTTGQNLGVIRLQTNNTLLLADRNFTKKEEEKLHKAGFLTKEREELTKNNPIKFNGGSIMMKRNCLALTQEQHCQNLKTVSSEAENLTSSRGIIRKMVSPKEQYIAQRARGAYITTVCQPEAAFDLSSAAQVTNPMEEDVRKLNKRLMWQKDNLSRGLNFIPLKAPFKLVVFTDSSFANNTDYFSQIGYVIILADKDNKANILLAAEKDVLCFEMEAAGLTLMNHFHCLVIRGVFTTIVFPGMARSNGSTTQNCKQGKDMLFITCGL
jgi:hypothetical protein